MKVIISKSTAKVAIFIRLSMNSGKKEYGVLYIEYV